MRDFADMAGQLEAHHAEFSRSRADRLPTAFVWRDPSTIPPRPWLYGRHLIRKQVSVTVALGGVGKSSLMICEALVVDGTFMQPMRETVCFGFRVCEAGRHELASATGRG